MCQKKAVDSAVDLDALIQVSVPMSHVKTRGYGQGERNDDGSSCWPAAHSHEKEADQAKRNSAEPPKPAKAKAPPPLPHAGVQQTIPWDNRFEKKRNDDGSSCWPAAHAHQKEADQAKRNSAEQPKPVKAKAPPPLLHAGVQQTIPLDGRFEETQEKTQTF